MKWKDYYPERSGSIAINLERQASVRIVTKKKTFLSSLVTAVIVIIQNVFRYARNARKS